MISIHAARVGCDNFLCYYFTTLFYFNPRSPSGLRLPLRQSPDAVFQFQSTQPEWAATINPFTCCNFAVLFQSTQPEWAATVCRCFCTGFTSISIHAARVGCDSAVISRSIIRRYFNPRSPSGLRQVADAAEYAGSMISIHAARVGCDQNHILNACCRNFDFNPRSPSGLRQPAKDMAQAARLIFQSTQPEWAATLTENDGIQTAIFQSTQPEWAATLN